jgi:hypothetical protein
MVIEMLLVAIMKAGKVKKGKRLGMGGGERHYGDQKVSVATQAW